MNRMDKINTLIRKEISNMIHMKDVKDPRLDFVSITKVDVSKDLRNARVYFSVLTDKKEDIENARQGLTSARKYIRKLVGERIRIRYTPEFSFFYDDSIEYSARINQTLEEINSHRSEQESDESPERNDHE